MHPIVIILLILVFIFLIQSRRWMDQVERGKVSFFKFQVILFLLAIMVLRLLWLFPSEAITKMCYGMLAVFNLISIINTKTNSSEKSEDDLRIWSGGTILLMYGTGALTLMIHAPDSFDEIILLLGFASSLFYYMFLRVSQ